LRKNALNLIYLCLLLSKLVPEFSLSTFSFHFLLNFKSLKNLANPDKSVEMATVGRVDKKTRAQQPFTENKSENVRKKT
jgi:hypothetical protein